MSFVVKSLSHTQALFDYEHEQEKDECSPTETPEEPLLAQRDGEHVFVGVDIQEMLVDELEH
jgi:hypothetical protein